ncbi:MAG TPA: glycosyltransferase [Methylomirabilota bacterium]|nr:glycosyltransferase [Methylomirabilota bacterium]
MADRVRVLELLVSTELGGGPAHVRDLIANLPREEFAFTVAAPGSGPYAGTFRALGAEFVDMACDRLSIRTLSRVKRLVRAGGVRIVHSHGKGAGLYGRLAARASGVPAIHTFHGIHYQDYPAGLRGAYLGLERWLAGMTYAVVHVSESQSREAEPLGLAPAGHTRVIVNGVDAERVRALRALSRAELGLEPGALVAGTIARFDPVKGLEVLLDAFARLPGPDARLLIVGDGPRAGRLRARARELGIERRVVFGGVVPEAARCLPAVDLYVSASRGEGLPLSLLEAMACGVPIVATRVAGHIDAVEDGVTGLLVPVDDPAALASAMAALLADPARRARLGAAGRRRVEERFSVERMTDELAALYRAAARF